MHVFKNTVSSYKMSQYFPKLYEPFCGDINTKVDLSNYATKTDIKNISHVDTSSFALKKNSANLKSEADKLDIDKLVPVPVDLSKLSKLATKTALTTVENKIPDVTNLATKAALTAVESKIPDINNLATKTALTNLSNTVPDISTLIKKATMIQKLQKLKINILVIPDLAQSKCYYKKKF